MPRAATASCGAVSISPAPERPFPGPNRINGRDRCRDYHDDLYRLPGSVEGRVLVPISTMRGPAIRIVSASKANGKEFPDHERNPHQGEPQRPTEPAGGSGRPRGSRRNHRTRHRRAETGGQQRSRTGHGALRPPGPQTARAHAVGVRSSASTYRRRPSETGNRARAVLPARPGPCSRFSTRRPRRPCGRWMRHLRDPPEKTSGGSMRSHDRTAAANDTHGCDITR